MKKLVISFLLFDATLSAELTSFAGQVDMVADLSDTVLDDIYRHRLGYCPQTCEQSCARSFWVEGFGSYRERDRRRDREEYENWLGGILGGYHFQLSSQTSLNFFLGASWGEIDIRRNSNPEFAFFREPNFDTDSILFGISLEKYCTNQFLGFTLVAGVLEQKREYLNNFEKAQGVFLTPEVTYATAFSICNFCPIFTSTLRYAGFFPGDYQERELFGTLQVRNRSVQLFTLREELALPWVVSPYIGVAGRFQFAGHRVESRLLLDGYDFSTALSNNLGIGFLGLRGSFDYNCFGVQANIEGSYDSCRSYRVLGELSLNYLY